MFPFPLFTTCVHMIVQFLLASLMLYVFPRFRPKPEGRRDASPASEEEAPDDAQQRSHSRPLMTRWFYFTRIGPCGTATGLDIGLGNMSLKYISLTFYSKLIACFYSATVVNALQQCVNPQYLALSLSLPSSFDWKNPPGSSLA